MSHNKSYTAWLLFAESECITIRKMANGLNEYLQPVNSPVAQNQGAVDSYQFYAQNERNSVTLTKIKNFSFNSGQGGTLTLGGTENGNGLMVVNDASGSTIVTVDNDGITINGGSITIYDAQGSTILDSQGLVSLNNFTSAGTSVSGGFGQTITSSSYVGLTGGTVNVVNTRPVVVMILADVRAKLNGVIGTINVSGEAFIDIFVGGTAESNTEIHFKGEYDSINIDHYGNYLDSSFSTHSIKTIAAGTTPISLSGRLVDTANSQLVIYNYKLSYVILGT